MAFEVYTGTRPGRPRLLLIVNAALLLAALGLAGWQVYESHALGPVQRVGDTPLRVRPPRGWRADPRNPGSFVLPVADRGRQPAREFARRIQFEFIRLPAFQAPEQLLHSPALENFGQVAQARRARIGKYDALEALYVMPLQIGRMRLRGQIIVRFTCLPRGQLLKVIYEPLIDLRPSDEQILDAVCQSLHIDDPTLNDTPADYLAHAGLTFPLEPSWQMVGTDFEAVPGVFLGGSSDKGPAWAIGVLRTWLAAERTPQDLLRDVAAQEWLNWDVDRLLREHRRDDGATVATIRHAGFGELNTDLPSAWVVSQSASQTVMLLVYAAPADAARADAVAEQLAGALQIAPLKEFSALADAEATGAKLLADLHKSGPAPRWGRESVETTYRQVAGEGTLVVRRGAVQRDPAQGYEGSVWRRMGRASEERQAWTLDGRALTYKWQADLLAGHAAVQIAEQRTRPEGPVTRRVVLDEQEGHRWNFTPGAAFVPPPAEDIIEGWVARHEAGAALVELSSPLGAGTHTALLRHLPPDGPYTRVLVQQDFWPLGSIEAFDDARAEMQQSIYPDAEYRRIK
jgi:hypothetical protein